MINLMEVKKSNKAENREKIERQKETSSKEKNATFIKEKATVNEMRESEANDTISTGQSSN
ncbi:hypothetical protein [Dokdonia sp. Hel_I_53]|uniref:hypothetical protein n=1 Tax=Dokdonia sp. Hel_I_53 TaxID=1566287 RepID=UPI00119CBABA|nr:hypothetical protein [Dokdonia sp. Hel_I_53]